MCDVTQRADPPPNMSHHVTICRPPPIKCVTYYVNGPLKKKLAATKLGFIFGDHLKNIIHDFISPYI